MSPSRAAAGLPGAALSDPARAPTGRAGAGTMRLGPQSGSLVPGDRLGGRPILARGLYSVVVGARRVGNLRAAPDTPPGSPEIKEAPGLGRAFSIPRPGANGHLPSTPAEGTPLTPKESTQAKARLPFPFYTSLLEGLWRRFSKPSTLLALRPGASQDPNAGMVEAI